MSKTPLSYYNDVLKEFNVTDDENVAPEVRLGYVRTQANEQKQILNRLFFDLATANQQQDAAQDSLSQGAHRQKADKFRDDIRQILTVLRTNQQLIKELENELAED